MTRITKDMYELLPVVIRLRDAENGSPLRQLFLEFEEQAALVERDIEHLYRNQFIETCEEWAVPYIGDLLGVRNLHPVTTATFSGRARVANTIGYRRRKGTAAMLEQLARDTTGWPASVVELFQQLDATQNFNHIRPKSHRTIDIRNVGQLELIGSAFDRACYTADVHGIDLGRRSPNIMNLAIFLWRLTAYPVVASEARAVDAAAQCWTFSPLGLDVPLFNHPQTETDLAHLATEREVPAPLRRWPLYNELNRSDRALNYFASTYPVLQIRFGDRLVPDEEIAVCNLETWGVPPDKKTAAFDPTNGRLVVTQDSTDLKKVYVSYSYGFSGDLGGGPYDREETVLNRPSPKDQWGIRKRDPHSLDLPLFMDAVKGWNSLVAKEVGRILLMDSETHLAAMSGADQISVVAGSDLTILAAEWPFPDGSAERENLQITVNSVRPHILGSICVNGKTGNEPKGALSLNGLLIEGDVKVRAGDLGKLMVEHCTIAPIGKMGNLAVSSTPQNLNDSLHVTIRRSIVRKIVLPPSVQSLTLEDCIVTEDIKAQGVEATISGCTILGSTEVKVIHAENSIFVGTLTAERKQEGCVRFCYIAPGSTCPRRYRCQPDLSLAGVIQKAATQQIEARMQPTFTSRKFGMPGLCQLGHDCPSEIRTGAEDGSEMGAFGFLKNPQREANLRASLDEYLRFGLQAGLFFST